MIKFAYQNIKTKKTLHILKKQDSFVLTIAAIAATQLPATAGETPAEKNRPRPNILFMIADDCTFRDLGCYGGVNVPTPNIDALASEGLRFTNFFQATPMSSPTRQCLMTGQYPIHNGAYPNHAKVSPETESVVQYMRALGYRVALQGKRHFAPETVFDYEFLSGGNDDVNVKKIRPFIESAKESGEPFCLFVCSHQPHMPWNKGDQNAIDPDGLTLPPYYVDTKELREDYRNYLAEVNYLDGQVGAVKDLLDETGVAENTIFFFTSEQGNSLPFAKYTCYDSGVQTGMIVRWPGVTKAGSTCDALAEYVDVVPTFIDIAGGKPIDKLDGKSFLKQIKGSKAAHKSEVYAAQTTRGIINGPEHYGIRSVRNERYVYVRNLTPEALFRAENTNLDRRYWQSWIKATKTDDRAQELVTRYQKRPGEELYDRIADPYQMNNLAGDPRYSKILAELSGKLDKWMESQGDKGNITELEAFEHQMNGQKGSQEKFLAHYRGRMMIADPYVFEEDGIYYAYGTGSPDGILAYRSIDLEHWEGPCGRARGELTLHKDDSKGNSKFWAPEVYKIGKKYVMTYSREERIATAFADSPLGPFKEEVVYTPDQNSIDSHIFIDDDGQAYLFWVRFGLGKGNEIRCAKLSEDLKRIESEQVECLHAQDGTWERTEAGRVAEGPFILKHDGTYYLTYSCNDFRSQDYAVGYATSKSPLGPWKKYEGNPILRKPSKYVGTGHHAFFKDKKGKPYIVFHAHNSDGKVTPRQTLIAPCRFDGDRLVIDTDNIIEPVIY